jgi:hypothetical protein
VALLLFGLAVCFAQKGNVPHGGEVSVLLLNIFLLRISNRLVSLVVFANGFALGEGGV